MQFFRHSDDDAALVGWGVRVMLLALAPEGSMATRALAGLGSLIETEAEVYTALAAMIDDPIGYGLFVMDCDGFGGLAEGQRVAAMLVAAGLKLPVLLISRDCREQIFPTEPTAPVLLRAPLTAVSLRVGFQHALRDRLAAQIWH